MPVTLVHPRTRQRRTFTDPAKAQRFRNAGWTPEPVEEISEDRVPEGLIADVLAWVDNDPDRAQAALDAEQASSARPTLIHQLEQIATPDEGEKETDQ